MSNRGMSNAYAMTYHRLHQHWSSKLGAPVALHIWSWHDFEGLKPGIPRSVLELALRSNEQRTQAVIHHQVTTHLLWSSGDKLQSTRYPRQSKSEELQIQNNQLRSEDRTLILEYCLRQGRCQLLQELMKVYPIFKPRDYPVILEPASAENQIAIQNFIRSIISQTRSLQRETEIQGSAIWLHVCASGFLEVFNSLLAAAGIPDRNRLSRGFEYACFHGHYSIVQRILRNPWLAHNAFQGSSYEEDDMSASYFHIADLMQTQPHIFTPQIRELVSDYIAEVEQPELDFLDDWLYYSGSDDSYPDGPEDEYGADYVENLQYYDYDYGDNWYRDLETYYYDPRAFKDRNLYYGFSLDAPIQH